MVLHYFTTDGLKRNVSDRNHKSPWQIGPFEGSSSSKQRRQYSLAEQELPLGGSPALPNHHHHANQTRDHLCRVVIRSPNTPTGSRHEKKQYCHVKLSQRKSWSKLERLSPSSSQDSTTGSASSSRDIQTCLRGRANHLGRGSSDEDDDDDEDDVCQRGSANYVTVLKIDDSPTGVSRQLKQSQYHRNCIPDPPWIKPERPSRPCGNRVKSVIKSYEIEPKEEHPRKFSDSSVRLFLFIVILPLVQPVFGQKHCCNYAELHKRQLFLKEAGFAWSQLISACNVFH